MQHSSEAYSFGLINISRSYHVLSIFTDELGGLDLELQSGSRKLFSILHVGLNPSNNHKLMSLGLAWEVQFACPEFPGLPGTEPSKGCIPEPGNS